MGTNNNTIVISFSIALFLLLILLLLITYNSKCQIDNVEKYDNFYGDDADEKLRNVQSVGDLANEKINPNKPNEMHGDISNSDPLGNAYNEVIQSNQVDEVNDEELSGANSCFPKDRLTSSDLLPQDANSKWAQINPSGAGDIQDQNYLTAGYHIGINTVGQSLRNANLQLRYEIPNPQIPVSPWQISTIEPDSRTHGLLDIGSSAPTY
tara:strand:+ start:930 stop:1556 length:627 start_codon:yes stop_codon:yes gene_type:complete